MRHALTVGFALVLAALAACQPSLNWREVRPGGSGAVALFPCKPAFDERPAGAGQGAMGLAQCEAGKASFSLAWAEVVDPTQVGAALRAMPEALANKLKVPLVRGEALTVPGMTPYAEAVQWRLQAAGVVARSAVFAYGTTVYQAVWMGPADDAPAWDNFIGSLRVGSAAQAAR
jgi:hypothetical protein